MHGSTDAVFRVVGPTVFRVVGPRRARLGSVITEAAWCLGKKHREVEGWG